MNFDVDDFLILSNFFFLQIVKIELATLMKTSYRFIICCWEYKVTYYSIYFISLKFMYISKYFLFLNKLLYFKKYKITNIVHSIKRNSFLCPYKNHKTFLLLSLAIFSLSPQNIVFAYKLLFFKEWTGLKIVVNITRLSLTSWLIQMLILRYLKWLNCPRIIS